MPYNSNPLIAFAETLRRIAEQLPPPPWAYQERPDELQFRGVKLPPPPPEEKKPKFDGRAPFIFE